MRKTVFLFLFFTVIISCKKENECIDVNRVADYGCSASYIPVCGCDGMTYGNSCVAARSGLNAWTEGACK